MADKQTPNPAAWILDKFLDNFAKLHVCTPVYTCIQSNLEREKLSSVAAKQWTPNTSP